MLAFDRTALNTAVAAILAAWLGGAVPATARPPAAPASFTATLSNNTPLAFGMHAQDAAQALGAPLSYVSGRPGNEILLAIRHGGGSGWFARNDRLYLQFRHGRLTGWKGDWGNRWMWPQP